MEQVVELWTARRELWNELKRCVLDRARHVSQSVLGRRSRFHNSKHTTSSSSRCQSSSKLLQHWFANSLGVRDTSVLAKTRSTDATVRTVIIGSEVLESEFQGRRKRYAQAHVCVAFGCSVKPVRGLLLLR